MITLTDYHVSRTLGYIDASVRFADPLGGMTAPPPIQVPLDGAIGEAVATLDALICAALESEIRQRAGADRALTVAAFEKPPESPADVAAVAESVE